MEKWTKISLVSHSILYMTRNYIDHLQPAPDRTGKISKFNFDAYAVLEATPSQSEHMPNYIEGAS